VLRGEREGLLRFVEERLAASKRCNNAAVRELLRTAEKLPGKGLEEVQKGVFEERIVFDLVCPNKGSVGSVREFFRSALRSGSVGRCCSVSVEAPRGRVGAGQTVHPA
jgi:hypothetical protein